MTRSDDFGERVFKENYESFLKNSQSLMIKKISYIKQYVPAMQGNALTHFQKLTDEVISELKSEKCINAIWRSIELQEDFEIARLFDQELEFFNSYMNALLEKERPSIREIDFGIKASETIKSSLEKIFSLPSWLKKILHILNEILNILSFSVGASVIEVDGESVKNRASKN